MSRQSKDNETIQFSTFKNKKIQIMTTNSENTFKLSRPNNVFTLALAITYFLKKCPQTLKQWPFKGITMEQVPRQFLPYQHDETLLSLLNIITSKIIIPDLASELINCYPIVQFTFNIFIRSLVMKQINLIKNQPKKAQNIQLMGNQEEIVCDYSFQLRGNLLSIAAECLDIYMTITYDQNSNIQEHYGNVKSTTKLEVIFNKQQFYTFSMISNAPSSIIVQNRPQSPCSRQSYSRKTPLKPIGLNKHVSDGYRGNPESKSISKEFASNICQFCQKKATMCDCIGKANTRANPSKLAVNSPYNAVSPLRHAFDTQPYILNAFQQTNSKNSRKCQCNRSHCQHCQQD